MADHRKLSNSEFLNLLNQLATKADGNAADFGLTQDIVDEAKARRIGLQTKVNDQTAKKSAAKASTSVVNQTRKGDDEFLSDVKAMMRLAKVSPDKFIEAGFDEDDSIVSIIVLQTPTDLVVSGASDGINKLKFNRNGNKPKTVFLVEAKIGNATDFVIIGTSMKQTFEHKNQKPGVKVVYRIRAQRGDDYSDYSNTVTVYDV